MNKDTILPKLPWLLNFQYGGEGSRLGLRLVALKALFSGRMSLRQFILFSFPVHWWAPRTQRELWGAFNAFVKDYSREALGSFVKPDGSVEIAGKRFVIPMGDYEVFISLFKQIFEADQYNAKRFIKRGSVVVDAGANMGLFSVFASLLGGKVTAFEPAPDTFAGLRENLAPYGGNALPYGVGEEVTEKTFLIYPDTIAGNRFDGVEGNVSHDIPARSIPVKMTTIDAVMQGARVDFIKMDIEGFEAEALRGAAETIKKWKPAISMSAYHKKGDKETLPALLRSICPEYICELHSEHEEDLVCYVK